MKTLPDKTGYWNEIEISQLLADTRAHLPQDEKYRFWADKRLAELVQLVERLMPFGAIQVGRPQPTPLWVLVYKDNGKRKVAVSFDGPPSDAYMMMVDANIYKKK